MLVKLQGRKLKKHPECLKMGSSDKKKKKLFPFPRKDKNSETEYHCNTTNINTACKFFTAESEISRDRSLNSKRIRLQP